MKKGLSLFGLILTFTIMIVKLTHLTIEGFSNGLSYLIILIIIDLFFIVGFLFIFLKDQKEIPKETNKITILPFVVILTAALLIYFVSKELHIDKTISVGLLAIVFGIFIKKHDKTALVGAFIGTSILLNTTYFGIVLISLVAGFIYYLLADNLNGLGGKLGTIVFVSGLIIFLILGEPVGVKTETNLTNLFAYLGVSLITALLVFILNNEFKLGPVTAYGIITIIGSLFLLFPLTRNLDLATIVYGAGFVGMTSKKAKNDYFILIFASLLFGLFSSLGLTFLNIGGRSGLLALISTISASGIYFLVIKAIKNIKKETINDL